MTDAELRERMHSLLDSCRSCLFFHEKELGCNSTKSYFVHEEKVFIPSPPECPYLIGIRVRANVAEASFCYLRNLPMWGKEIYDTDAFSAICSTAAPRAATPVASVLPPCPAYRRDDP